MLHGPAMKAVVWFVTIAGLTPAVVLALAALAHTALRALGTPSPPEGKLVLRSNIWLQVGPFRIDDWHPRAWPAVVLLVGAVLVVTALAILMHVPKDI
jgi:hypothetical protein